MDTEAHHDESRTPAPGRWLRIVNYSMAVLFAVLGVLVLAGYPVMLEGNLRWILGGVLLLWAAYRAISTRTKFPIA